MNLRLRSAEWLLVIYFGYVAAIAPRFPLEQSIVWRPFLVEVLVCALFLALAYGESHEHAELFSMLRDWVPVALLLLAYREMDWFSAHAAQFRFGTALGGVGPEPAISMGIAARD